MIAWLVAVIAITWIRERKFSVFSIITLIVSITTIAGHFLSPVHRIFTLIPSLDASIIGLIFVGSMLTSRPFVLSLVASDTLERTERKFGKSKFFYKAWFDVNIMWGMFYIVQGLIISYLMILNLQLGNIMSLLFSWPSVLVLLYISVDHPRRYWDRHAEKMRMEIEAAELYEKQIQMNQPQTVQ